MKDYHKPGYWKDWYWNKGGRDKVQYSRKVTQPLNYQLKRKTMIESVIKKVHPDIGIIYILINTKHKWLNYQVNNTVEDGKIALAFFYSIETQPGQFEEYEEQHFIDMKEGFDVLDYVTTTKQERIRSHSS